MSNESTNFPNVENLTPFEYALAGVPVPEAQGSPSLSVIEQMRRLAVEVDDAPITQPRLREFLQTGGSIAKRNDRRSVRRRRPSTEATAPSANDGQFVDITPVELSAPIPAAEASILFDSVDQQLVDDQLLDDHLVEDVVDDGAAALADGGPPATGDGISTDDGLGSFDVDASDVDSVEEIDRVHASIRAAIISGGVDLDEPVADAPVLDDPLRNALVPDDPLRDAPVLDDAGLLDDLVPAEPAAIVGADLGQLLEPTKPLDRAELEDDHGAPSAGELLDPDDPAPQPELIGLGNPSDPGDLLDHTGLFDQVDEPVPSGDPHELAPVEAAVPVIPLLFPEVPTLEGDGHDDAHPIDPEVRPESSLWPDTDPTDGTVPPDGAILAEAADDETAILVPAVGGAALAGILETGDEAQPVVGVARMAAITSTVPGRRFGGGTLAALAGTAAAAAALIIGGLWWTNGLDRTEAETATATVDDLTEASPTDAGIDTDIDTGAGGDSSQGGSPDGSAEDGSEPTEFGATNGSSTSAPSSTVPTTRVVKTTTSLRKTTTSTTPSITSSAPATASTSTTEPSSTIGSETTAAQQTSTTRVQPTNVTPSSRRSATTAAPLGFVGDSVTIGSYGGDGAAGVLVELYGDTNQDGVAESLRASAVTSSSGRYGFNVAGGCYVVRFYPPDGFQLQSGHQNQPVCVDPGGANGRVDAVILPTAAPAGPSGCFVEGPGDEEWRGVEVFENQSNWATSYTFYTDKGKVVVRTRDIGPADDVEGPTNREWHAESNNFDHRKVYSVAAERNGTESNPVSCNRASS